jgi:hypothetical protein
VETVGCIAAIRLQEESNYYNMVVCSLVQLLGAVFNFSFHLTSHTDA